jgi:hypothetical protein
MPTITIEIPKKILERGGSSRRRLTVVDPEEFEKEMRRRWELEDATARSGGADDQGGDAIEASRAARREWKEGKTRQIKSLKELM